MRLIEKLSGCKSTFVLLPFIFDFDLGTNLPVVVVDDKYNLKIFEPVVSQGLDKCNSTTEYATTIKTTVMSAAVLSIYTY